MIYQCYESCKALYFQPSAEVHCESCHYLFTAFRIIFVSQDQADHPGEGKVEIVCLSD